MINVRPNYVDNGCDGRRFRVIASDSLEVANFNISHLHWVPPLGVTSVEFCRDLRHQKTRVLRLSFGLICMILRLALSVQHRLLTDRRTDRQIHDYGICGASMAFRGKKNTKYNKAAKKQP